MGRAEKSQGLAPQATRKDARAKFARQIINKTIPALLSSNPRARQGVESSALFANPKPTHLESTVELQRDQDDPQSEYVKRKGQGRRKIKHGQQRSQDSDRDGTFVRSADKDDLPVSASSTPHRPLSIRVVQSDTLTVAGTLSIKKNTKKPSNVCVLNMASPLRPGGGVLAGATSQEEFLCARTTLLPSLKESFYRLPDVGGIFTHDVLVFRSAEPLGDISGELLSDERFWIDVISAAALRFPELEGKEDEAKHLSSSDRELVEAKMRAVLRIADNHKVKKLVLGAWGCGAYGNPVLDIANSWQRVLINHAAIGNQDICNSIEEIVFAITNQKMAAEFAKTFNLPMDVITGPGAVGEDDGEEDNQEISELQEKIAVLEKQYETTRFPDLKIRLGVILNELKTELDEKRGSKDDEEDLDGD